MLEQRARVTQQEGLSGHVPGTKEALRVCANTIAQCFISYVDFFIDTSYLHAGLHLFTDCTALLQEEEDEESEEEEEKEKEEEEKEDKEE
ncbi:hypothetical protein PoB_002249000 [Plakobranchus ocellatus]|uniref:Uncharacterized protein n=1 Tax=Plakobranchus ocellatus TaxID=259542 RepID=A0AAV3ZLI5_9GAST|nr:hypothetical protein PoB_002249000 [Plakobranchus ocellatus]